MTPDPSLHQTSAPTTRWTTVNAAEAMPGVMTPLGFSFWVGPCERGLRSAFAAIGVLPRREVRLPDRIDDRFSGLFWGRYAANLDSLRMISDLTPGTSGDQLEEQMFGAASEPRSTSKGSARRYPFIAAKMPIAIALLTRQLAAATAEVDAWWHTATARTSDGAAGVRDAGAVIERALRTHMTATMIGQALFDQLVKLARSVGRDGLELTLSTGYGTFEETQLVSELLRCARDEITLDAFLSRYGFHGPDEGELSSRSWREDPTPLHHLIRKYRASGRDNPPETEQGRRDARAVAERTLLDALPKARRPGAALVLRLARRYIPLREVGKANFLKGIDGGRHAARTRGAELVADGVLDDADDVFYLTLDEALGALPVDPRGAVARRRADRERCMKLDLPKRWTGNPEPIEIDERTNNRADRVDGLPASPGVVEGRVRVVLDAYGCDELDDGEVLVCPTTDPSWVAAFHLAAAVVIDIGGPVSHAAILSRELGLPCVINTGDGTSSLRTGDLVRVDGAAGTVVVLTRASE